jgi:urease accessory protein
MLQELNAAAPRGWRARLRLEFQGRTLRDRVRTEGGVGEPCHAYILHPPGGVASGDDLRLDVTLSAGAHAVLTTPAAGKFYRRGSAGPASTEQHFQVNEASLEWLPQENIFYPNAAALLRSVIRLSGDARFMGWEIACLGLPACGNSLEAGRVRLCFDVWRDSTPLFLDRLELGGPNLSAPWGMANHAVLGCAVVCPGGPRELELGRALAAENCADLTIACTLIDGVLVCRGMAQRTDRLKASFIRLWRGVRPGLVGREAVLPRIWAT